MSHLLCGLPALLMLAAGPVHAASLASSLHRFVSENSSLFVGVADTLTPLVERLAARATALPATSTVPGFAYVLDFESGALVRAPGSFGAVFVDRPETVGRGIVAFGTSYLHADLDQFDGSDFAGQIDYRSRVAFVEGPVGRTRLDFTHFTLTLDSLSPFVTYGITERWDVNLVLPLVRTGLSVAADQFGRLDDPSGQPLAVIQDTVGLDAVKFGPGDLLMRTKYRLGDYAGFGLGAVLAIRAPTGDPDDFQGLGDWTLQPALLAARRWGPHDTHASLGVEVDADDVARSRAGYAIGGTLQIHSRVAALLDVIGTSGFVANDFRIDAFGIQPQSRFLDRFQTRPTQVLGVRQARVFSSVPRTDAVDLVVGAKVQLFSRAAGFVSVLVPIVRDGLRASAVPVGGVEYTF